MSRFEKFIRLIESNDPKVAENAYNHLWQLEENGELTPSEIAKFFKHTEKTLLIQYAIEATGRLKDPVLFAPAAEAFDKLTGSIQIQFFLENFRETQSDFFVDKVLRKIGYKKNILTGTYKKDVSTKEKNQPDLRFIMLPAVKYLEVCVNQSHTTILKELLTYPDSGVRFHVLYAAANQKIDLGRELIEKVIKSDPHPLNVRQAQFVFEVMYDTSEKENPFSYLL